jgi:hypothetical protein
MAARKPRERDLDRKFVKLCNEMGWLTLKTAAIGGFSRGWPDRLVIIPGGPNTAVTYVFVELKAPEGAPTALQDKMIRTLRAIGCTVHVLRSQTELDLFERTYA